MIQSVGIASMGIMPFAEPFASQPYRRMDTPTFHAVLEPV